MCEFAEIQVLFLDERNHVAGELRDKLDHAGILVEHVHNGAEAIRLVKRLDPDLVLINEVSQLESGWLSACKLRLAGWRGPLWICSRREECWTGWREVCEVDEVIFYHDAEDIRKQITHWAAGVTRGKSTASSTTAKQGRVAELVAAT